jgi:penicillin-binding protein 1A
MSGKCAEIKASALYHSDLGHARNARPRARYNRFVASSERKRARAARGPSRPRLTRWLRILLLIAGICTLLTGAGAAVAGLWVLTILPRSLPNVAALETLQPLAGSKIYDDNDELITELHVERRIFVPLAQVPQALRDAVIATEDRRFYSHWGVDPIGIARAVYQNYRHARIVEGGSTITQQLTKLLFLTPDKSLDRKMKEAVLALELERRYSKDRILEMYLNQIYFGHGAYGVEAAARTYFGKSVAELNVRESALLAGLPRAPSSYSPFEHPDLAKRRREVVLRRMVEYGSLKDKDAKRFAATDLGLIPADRRRTTGQYFLEYVSQQLEAKYGADLVFKGGLNVYTTLNRSMQLAAEQSLRDGLRALESRTKGRAADHPEGAVVTIEPHTGYVRAVVGGYDFFRSEFNRAVYARRQPGSAFKPFVYAAAIESGLTPATRIDDSPVNYPVGQNGQAWKPENYDRKFRGSTTLQQALEESVNVVTIKLLEEVGIGRTVKVARRLGITSPLTNDLTLALGTSDLTLLEITSAYGALANLGLWMPPTTIRYVTDPQGKLLEEHVPQGREVMSQELAYVVTHMLRGVVERGTGQAAKALARPVAAKTGTTNDYSNAWFIGYTPKLATGVWVGYDKPRSLGRDETGSRVAVPIWVSYMGRILADTPKEDFAVPERVVVMPVDLDASNECVRVVPMAFVRGTEPSVACGPRRQQVPTGDPAAPSTLPREVGDPTSVIAPPPASTMSAPPPVLSPMPPVRALSPALPEGRAPTASSGPTVPPGSVEDRRPAEGAQQGP